MMSSLFDVLQQSFEGMVKINSKPITSGLVIMH